MQKIDIKISSDLCELFNSSLNIVNDKRLLSDIILARAFIDKYINTDRVTKNDIDNFNRMVERFKTTVSYGDFISIKYNIKHVSSVLNETELYYSKLN